MTAGEPPDRSTPADVYTHGHHEAVLRSHRWRTAANSAAYLLPRLAPGHRVLDVGCGPGTISADLARLVAPGEVVGVDRSADAVAAAGHMADRPANLTFRTGDVYALDVADASFDVVHAHQLLQHLSDPVAALCEMRRVCRPDGVVAARDSDYASFAWAPLDERLDEWLTTYRRVARHNRAEPDAGRHLLGWAHAAGFSDVQPSATVWCFASPADREWWGGLWADRLRESELAVQAVDYGYTDEAGLDAMATAFEQWANHPDGWFAVLHGEVLATP
jgi:ubiquinone/menaquinone biosynthesis C-methylase UbiE